MTFSLFASIRHKNEYDQEYWSARELQSLLGYDKWERFEQVIERAIESCRNSKQKPKDHFPSAGKMVTLGSGAPRELGDYHLSRYACYLIAQNGDPRKIEIAEAQMYFALQTHKQEIGETLIEDRKRVYLRHELTEHNKNLASTAKKAGVSNYAEFTDFGYMGLYGGMRSRDIRREKGLKSSDIILDHMGSEELAANLFRATQADAKINRDGVKGQSEANKAHYTVGKKIRSTIEEIGGTMPEKLESKENISKARTRIKQDEKGKLP